MKLQHVKEMIIQPVVCQTIVYFKKYYRMAVDLSKQQSLDADAKAIQQISFTGNIEQ